MRGCWTKPLTSVDCALYRMKLLQNPSLASSSRPSYLSTGSREIMKIIMRVYSS